MKQQTQQQITENSISPYIAFLVQSGKSQNTINKYSLDLIKFIEYVEEAGADQNVLVGYREWLLSKGYGYRSVNSYVSSASQLCRFLKFPAINPGHLKPEETEVDDGNDGLTNVEYQRLLRAAFRYDMEMLGVMLQVLAGTPLRYNEMCHITVEALKNGGLVEYERRGKNNAKKRVRLSEQLVEVLEDYADRQEIVSGMVFRNSRGNFPHRGNVWRSMKHLCAVAEVDPDKVSPQKIKKAFVKDYYSVQGKKMRTRQGNRVDQGEMNNG